MQMQAMMKKQEQLQLALQQKKIEEQMIEAELEKSYQNKQIDNSNTRYVQHVALPNSNPDEKTYMYSTISLDVRIFWEGILGSPENSPNRNFKLIFKISKNSELVMDWVPETLVLGFEITEGWRVG